MLEKLTDLDARSISPEMARRFLPVAFEPSHQRRVRILSEKARKGTLLPADQAELDDFIRVADLLTILYSKARQALKHAGVQAWPYGNPGGARAAGQVESPRDL